ncbi:MAG: hypothetical protein Q8N84_04010, partial [bacterium]|nr:hypothetical protein [bacterium]
AHFENIPSLLYLAFVQQKMGIEDGSAWVLGKLHRDWESLELPESRQLVESLYQAAKITLQSKPLL